MDVLIWMFADVRWVGFLPSVKQGIKITVNVDAPDQAWARLLNDKI
jgi:hypothetical protein